MIAGGSPYWWHKLRNSKSIPRREGEIPRVLIIPLSQFGGGENLERGAREITIEISVKASIIVVFPELFRPTIMDMSRRGILCFENPRKFSNSISVIIAF